MKLVLGKESTPQPEAAPEEVVAVEEQQSTVQENFVSNEDINDTSPQVETGTWAKEFADSHPELVREATELREQNAAHFVLNNRTTKAIYKANAVHFREADTQELKEIDNTLKDDGEVLKSSVNTFRTAFSKTLNSGKVFDIEKNGCRVSLAIADSLCDGCCLTTQENSSKASSEVVVKDAYQNSDIQYIVDSDKIKENIIVKERAENYVYNFSVNISGLNVGVSEDGDNLELINKASGEVEFTIPKPFMIDANNVYSDLVYYEIESQSDDVLSLRVIANPEYMDAEDRAYPVIIDPQIISGNSSLFRGTNYYRMISSSGSGSGYGNWMYDPSSSYYIVGKDSTREKRCDINIMKSLMGLKNHKILKATLKLRPYQVNGNNSVYVSHEGYIYLYSGQTLEINLTSQFRNYSGDFTISLTPGSSSYYSYSEILFYTGGTYSPYLEVEYITNENFRPTKKEFSLAGQVRGEVNLASGEVVNSFSDIVSVGAGLGYNISHVYKKTGDNFHMGSNFRLNLHEKLEKTSESYLDMNYVYTDENGEKHGFKDLYYYLNSSDDKVYVTDKSKITIELDGRLMFNSYEIFKEQRTSSGLKASTKLEGIKNIELIEQRQDEVKQLEEQVESYRINLQDIVCVDKDEGTIYARLKNSFSSNTLSKAAFDNFMSSVTSSRLVLSENEALSYRSMKLQYTAMGFQDTATKYQVIAMGYQSTGMQLQIDSINNSIERSNSKKETKLTTDETNNYTSTKNNLVAQIISNDNQKNLTNDSIKPNSLSQTVVLNNQITALQNKRSQYITQIKKLYKEFANKSFELEQAKKQLPVSYLSDGKIIKGFNEIGNLVVVYDSHNNSLIIEYDYKNRISKVYESETKANLFKYNNSGLLSSITDTRGRMTKYFYNSQKLMSVEFADGRVVHLTYDHNDYITQVKSSDGLMTSVARVTNSISLTNYSTIDRITKTTPTGASTGNIQLSKAMIIFNTNNTIVDDTIGTKEYYIFNSEGNNTEYYLEEDSKVTKAEQYEYVQYSTSKVKYASKDTLNLKPKSSFSFVNGNYEYTTLDQFNNPSKVETNARKIDTNSTQKTVTDYTFNNDQKCEKTRTTITTVTPHGTDVKYSVTKYYYNTSGNTVRTESYIEGEELTQGISIEETIFDDKGHEVKSFSYNSLDSSSKLYNESEYTENGQVTAELDSTGENKVKYEYLDGTNIVKTQTNANGGKFSYGYDLTDTVTAITASTEDGEENSTQTEYNLGVVTELRSGNNQVNYEYDHKRRQTAVNLNGEEYLKISYADNTTLNGTKCDKVTITNLKGEVSTSYTDKKGNLIKTQYGSNDEVTCTYDKDKLKTLTDGVTGEVITHTYDGLERVTSTAKTVYSPLTESYTYDGYGNVATKSITTAANHQYVFSYKDNAARDVANLTFKRGGSTVAVVTPKTDYLGRASEKIISNGGNLAGEYYYYRKVGDHATNMISTIRYGEVKSGNYVINDSLKYAYDVSGNISKVYENGILQASYTYDKLNRLVREDNKRLNKSYFFSYDNNGNILSKAECGYTTKAFEDVAIEQLSIKEYAYSAKGDRLMSWGDTSFAYDSLGNPTMYKGKAVSWAKGRQMTEYGDTTYAYNGQGQRISKTSGGVTVTYTYTSDGKLLKQSNGIEYIYDNGGISGIIYNNSSYYYRKNGQGDVIGLIDSTGTVVVKYTYDAWGNYAIIQDTNGLAEVNPIRYRSYYYDTETALYFLKTRYYDPETGRFITIDDTSYLDPETINGLNLYAYCGDNPVMRGDPNGNAWWHWIVGAFVVVAVAAATVLTAGLAGAALSAFGIGSVGLATSMAVGAGVGALSAGVVSLISQGAQGAFNFGDLALNTLFGGVSGAIGGTGLGLIGQTIAGSALGFGEYAITALKHGKDINLMGSLFSTILGAVAGFMGGPGSMASGIGDLTGPAFWRNMYPNSKHFKSFFTTQALNSGKSALIRNLVITGLFEPIKYILEKNNIWYKVD